MATVTAEMLTAEQMRRIRDNINVLSNRPDGVVDISAVLNAFAAAVAVDIAALEAVSPPVTEPEEQIFVAEGTIAFAAVRTLFTTPVSVIPAPGAGSYIEVLDAHWFLDFASAAYDAAAAGDALGLKYTNAAGVQTVDTGAGNAIGAASADYHAQVRGLTEVNITAADNAPVVASLDAGDSPLKYRIRYRVRSTAIG